MKSILPAMLMLCSAMTVSGGSQAQDDFPVLVGPYLGQMPPGLTPKIFAPGIVSINGRYEGAISISPDLDEIYFAASDKDNKTSIYFTRNNGERWSPIKKANFSEGRMDQELHPFVSPDGKRIYFTAVSSDFTYTKIWYVNRIKNAWSRAVILDSPLNDDRVFFPNKAKNGGLYYYNISKRGTYYASGNNDTFSEIKKVEFEPRFNHAFIAPSNDYLLVMARNKTEGRNDNDLYVAFKKSDGSWAKPINLGKEINTIVDEKGASITHDGKYFFFGRDQKDEQGGKANIYWVSTQIIEDLRPKS